MTDYAYNYVWRRSLAQFKRKGRTVICDTCGTVDYAGPRREHCRFCVDGQVDVKIDGGLKPIHWKANTRSG